MSRLLCGLLAGLVLCVAAQAELTIEGGTKFKQNKKVCLTASGANPKAALVWDLDEEKCDVEEVGGKLYLWAPAGTYKIKCRAIELTKEGRTVIETARTTITIEGDTPTPGPGPTPPGPTPPGPGPTPAPIAKDGLRVLIIEESQQRSKLPLSQQTIILGKALRDYLNSVCVKEGGTRNWAEWRIWDQNVNASTEAQHWQDALKRDRKSVPWIIISNGKTGYEGPLPKDTDETIALVKKYAPASAPASSKKVQKSKTPAKKGGK